MPLVDNRSVLVSFAISFEKFESIAHCSPCFYDYLCNGKLVALVGADLEFAQL